MHSTVISCHPTRFASFYSNDWCNAMMRTNWLILNLILILTETQRCFYIDSPFFRTCLQFGGARLSERCNRWGLKTKMNLKKTCFNLLRGDTGSDCGCFWGNRRVPKGSFSRPVPVSVALFRVLVFEGIVVGPFPKWRLSPFSNIWQDCSQEDKYVNEHVKWVFEVRNKSWYCFWIGVMYWIIISFSFRKNVALLHVYYNKQAGYVYQTDILFTWQDLVCKLNMNQRPVKWIKLITVLNLLCSSRWWTFGTRSRFQLHQSHWNYVLFRLWTVFKQTSKQR